MSQPFNIDLRTYSHIQSAESTIQGVVAFIYLSTITSLKVTTFGDGIGDAMSQFERSNVLLNILFIYYCNIYGLIFWILFLEYIPLHWL